MKSITLGTAALLALPVAAYSEEQTLSYRLVVRDIEPVRLDVPFVEGQSIHATRAAGTAIFEDGRIANKTFVYYGDDGAETGDFTGYSTYTFENGDSLNLRFTGGWDADGTSGEYQVISGTGAYEGTTGSGNFRSVAAEWTDAYLLEGEFNLDVPGS